MTERLRIVPRSSRLLAGYLLLLHLVVLLALGLAPLSALSRWWAGFFVVWLWLGQYLWHIRSLAGVRALVREADGRWRLQHRAGGVSAVRLLPDSFVHPYLIILRFALGRWRRRVVILLPDSEDAEVLRRLRVCLRLATVTK